MRPAFESLLAAALLQSGCATNCNFLYAPSLVTVEIGVFFANRGRCPLTGVAEDLGAEDGRVSDIFLPEALARTLPAWSTAILLSGVVGHARSFRARRARR